MILVDQALVEQRGFSAAEDLGGEVEDGFELRAELRDVPDAIEASLGDAILHGAAVGSGALGDPFFVLGDGRAGGNCAVIFFDFLAGNFGSDVAGDDDGDVVGAVVSLKPFLDVLHAGGVEIGHGADDGPRIRMADRISTFGDELPGHAVGLIFTLTFFVLNHAALQVEFFLVENRKQVAHAIAFGEQRVIKHGGRDVFEIIGAIVVRGAVEVGGADAFHGVDVGEIEIFAAAEHQVFEEVGETGLAGFFVFGADVIPGVDGDDGSFVVLVDQDGEAVIEDKFGVRNVGNGDFRGGGFGGRGRGRLGFLRRSGS